MCERWAVLTSIFEPTDTVRQLAAAEGWCVVVVGDTSGEYSITVKYTKNGCWVEEVGTYSYLRVVEEECFRPRPVRVRHVVFELKVTCKLTPDE